MTSSARWMTSSARGLDSADGGAAQQQRGGLLVTQREQHHDVVRRGGHGSGHVGEADRGRGGQEVGIVPVQLRADLLQAAQGLPPLLGQRGLALRRVCAPCIAIRRTTVRLARQAASRRRGGHQATQAEAQAVILVDQLGRRLGRPQITARQQVEQVPRPTLFKYSYALIKAAQVQQALQQALVEVSVFRRQLRLSLLGQVARALGVAGVDGTAVGAGSFLPALLTMTKMA